MYTTLLPVCRQGHNCRRPVHVTLLTKRMNPKRSRGTLMVLGPGLTDLTLRADPLCALHNNQRLVIQPLHTLLKPGSSIGVLAFFTPRLVPILARGADGKTFGGQRPFARAAPLISDRSR